MPDVFWGLADYKIKLVDLGDGTYGWAMGSFPQSGGESVRGFTVTPTIQAAAYADGDLIGGKQTIANFVPATGGAATIQSILIANKTGNAARPAYEFVFYNANPTGSTFTENGAGRLASR